MPSERKILFTTVFRKGKRYDYWGSNTPNRFLRYTYPRICSFGLRFIKRNIPQIEILEYPSWREYTEKIKKGNYDVVGFSFYINEVPDIIKMVEFARKHGVKEIWGGNYGVLTPGIEKYFDRVFVGYAEREIGKELGVEVNEIKHPPIINYSGTGLGLKAIAVGVIFTTRGCTIGCKFCQTPSFCGKVSKIPLESIEEVLWYYKSLGIREVVISDENFGLLRRHANDVVELLEKYEILWTPMIRADFLLDNFETFDRKMMAGAFIGIESLDQRNLDFSEKREKVSQAMDLLERMNIRNKMVIGYYMIGFENDTADSIRHQIEQLKTFNLDLYQICIVTPFPKTKLWDYIERNYGIFDYDWRHYDTKHLVWNHPNISKDEMHSLLKWAFRKVYSGRTFAKSTMKFRRKYSGYFGFLGGLRYMAKSILFANRFDYIGMMDRGIEGIG